MVTGVAEERDVPPGKSRVLRVSAHGAATTQIGVLHRGEWGGSNERQEHKRRRETRWPCGWDIRGRDHWQSVPGYCRSRRLRGMGQRRLARVQSEARVITKTNTNCVRNFRQRYGEPRRLGLFPAVGPCLFGRKRAIRLDSPEHRERSSRRADAGEDYRAQLEKRKRSRSLAAGHC